MTGNDGKETCLVTGGGGFIGSHTVIELHNAGYNVIILDNLCNSNEECIRRVNEICGAKFPFHKVDLCNKADVADVFEQHKIDHVIHFAGLKAVGESCELPLLYYHNNLAGTMNLLQVMSDKKVYNLIFSSSATVYGDAQRLPVDESHPTGSCTNPYGKTKYFIEEILKDLSKAIKEFNIVSLRYFNPVGAHKSGRIGEDPQGPPNNLMPYISQVAVGKRPFLSVYGNDYDTKDGTGVRDYIHVVDLALGHIASLNMVKKNCGYKVYNLGTGNGYSVLELVEAMKKATGKEIPHKIVERREGDTGTVYADAKLALEELNWKAERGIEEMCEDVWRWQSNNPNGFHDHQS